MSQYMVGSKHKTTERVSFAERPRIHTNYSSAIEEAKRLAVIHIDKKFFVVQVKDVFQTVEIEKTIL